MDLFKFVQRGTVLSGIHARNMKVRREKLEAHDRYQLAALEECRVLWLDALTVDQTRSWMSISEEDRGVLSGLSTILTAAGLAKTFDDGNMDAPALGVIRGAISAAMQCGKAGSVIRLEDAQAFNTACERAREVIQTCSLGAIKHAAEQLHALAHSQVN